MIRIGLRVIVGCLLALTIWWIGPLLLIGTFRPFGWLLMRQVLVGLILFWGFWPLLVRLRGRLFMSSRRVPPLTRAKQADTSDAITLQVKDFDRQLARQWLKRYPGWRARWFGLRNGAHRAELPWLLVLGAAGSGKTTLIRRGNATASTDGDGASTDYTSDTSHTNTCHFWRLDNAIWIDVNGAWLEPGGALSSDASPGWQHLLKALAKLKRRPPIDNLAICVDADWLLHANFEQRKALSDSMRERLADVADHFDQKMAIHVLVTSLDKVPGALPFLNCLDESALEKGIGFSLPLPGTTEMHAVTVDQLRQIMAQLEAHIQQHIQLFSPHSGDARTNVALLEFTEAMSVLRERLLDVMSRCVVGNVASESCVVRGAWLGTSVDLTADRCATFWEGPDEHQEIRRLATLWRTPLAQMKSERGLVSSQAPLTPKARVWRLIRWSLCGSLATCLLVALTWAYLNERNYIDAERAGFAESTRLAEAASAGGSSGTAMIDVLAQMRYARDNIDEEPWLGYFPFFEHRRIENTSKETYRKHLRNTLMPEVYNYVRQTLTTELRSDAGNPYTTLKIYLMLAHPDKRDPDAIIRWMRPRWKQLMGSAYDAEDQTDYEDHLRALFLAKDIPGTPQDNSLVREARERAAKVPTVARVIDRIEDEGLPDSIEPVSLARAGGFGAAASLRLRDGVAQTDPVIPGWYTRAGYFDVFRPKLRGAVRDVMQEESWVLRDQPLSGNTFEQERAVQDLYDATQSQFLQDYIRHWQVFLNNVTVRSYSGLADASQIAASMMEAQSPLAQLMRFAGRETTLAGNFEGGVAGWLDSQRTNVDKSKRAIIGEITGERTNLRSRHEQVVDDYFDPVRRIALQIDQAVASTGGSNPLNRLFDPLYRQLTLVNGAMLAGQILPQYDAFARMRADAALQPEPIRGIMLDLVNGGSSMAVSKSAAMLSRTAAGATRAVCNQGLMTKYPFRRSASAEIGVQNFEALFSPQGELAKNFQDQLATYVDTSRSPWQAMRVDGRTAPLISAEVLRAYEAADHIRTAMLDEQGKLRVSVMIGITDMDPQIAEAQLDVGTTSLHYAHGSVETRRADWAANSSSGQVRVSLFLRSVDGHTANIRFDGPWALFRFFDSGRQSGVSADRRETVHDTSLGAVHVEWQALTTPAPLWSNLLDSFRCPR
ncbi:type VI secretion system protein ImpL [Paraburkholderia susongensis]|uniref:Type VI secretion system protein ImpL n=1 Tax=Paraburkholderia susongensis TaxID=1515439 RepID=A0A1X7M5T2_9BURK|nr:type VI secretion system protein ImpL [Paraburkholderia susongensis]